MSDPEMRTGARRVTGDDLDSSASGGYGYSDDYGSSGVDVSQASVGQLFSQVTTDLSTLMRQEVELAKAEVREEAKKAAKGAGMLGGAGLTGFFALLFLSVALMYLINLVVPLGWAAAIVGALYGLVALVLLQGGRKNLKNVSPAPTQTVETLKEDAQWAKARTR